MTELFTALMLTISHDGYWLSGRTETIEVRWPVVENMPAAVLDWQLEFANTRLAGDRRLLGSDETAARISLMVPNVRVPTATRWHGEILRKSDGVQLARAEQVVHLYPDELLAGLAARLAGRRVVVWDGAEGLPAILMRAGIRHTTVIAATAKLELQPLDILLIGANRLDDSPFSQSVLVGQARAGASVLVFAQSRPVRLANYGLLRRPRPITLEWRSEHPLLSGFAPADLNSLLGSAGDVWALELPADEPALEIAWWPPEAPGREPGPISALLVTRTLERGRLVLCQLPLGAWDDDPRAQLFLRNALDYLITRPEPTPRPSQRGVGQSPPTHSQPVIATPPGATR